MNVLTIDLINEINEFVLSLKDDRDTKVVVFKSLHESFFLAHLDLNVINGTQGGQAASIEFNHMIANIKAMKQVSVAVVDGVARGGGNEFVMACDLAYGTEKRSICSARDSRQHPNGWSRCGTVRSSHGQKNKALQALLLGNDFTAQQAEELNIITQFVPKAELDEFLAATLGVISQLEVRDIVMYKEIIATSIKDEDAGAELELRYFLERAKEQKPQQSSTRS
ncbi:enoyl-CoA hydratase/isomerase family protein [Vibrio sinaloensis]|nr:enoyl-CoA hydratase/isomerase family protein [Vibrio sinaloensis]